MRIKLKTKIWFTVLSIVLMFAFFSLYYFPAQQEKYLRDNYNNEVQNLANTISLGVHIALKEENFEGVQTAMSFVKDDPRLEFVKLLITDTIWDVRHSEFSTKDSVLITYPEDYSQAGHEPEAGSVIKKRSPFESEMMNGAIELAVTTDKIQMGKKAIRETSLLVSGLVFAIGILIGFWLSRNISVPVLALRDAAIRVGDGDLAQRVVKKSGDEIGELTTAFNKMVGDLEKAHNELNKANADLADANDALHATVSDLKAAQEQLIQAEKMASLGQLTAGVAHEINNPINFVSANIQPLKDDMTDVLDMISRYDQVIREKGLNNNFEEIEEYKKEAQLDTIIKEIHDLLRGMEEGAKRTSEIVRGLRNFSRMDQNEFHKADINECLESTLTLLHNSYKNRILIVREYGNIPEVDCFPGQINQVFMNILSNAIQAIPKEGTITVKTGLEDESVIVEIRDSGAGMTDEVKARIFDPFFTTKDVGKGTGLGLSISYGIIKKHNGEIRVFSKPGDGTEFQITIPVNQKITT